MKKKRLSSRALVGEKKAVWLALGPHWGGLGSRVWSGVGSSFGVRPPENFRELIFNI